ncbi:hypothetical protein DS608_21700 [Salmonella enterica subsp. enterica serovar Javiana]|nr:hypothetical protein [Salmonella enterica subsp. enterica serovar Javiana]
MYKPSISALIEIIRKAQSDVVELDSAISLYQQGGGSEAVIYALASCRDQNQRFCVGMFSDIATHDEEQTEEQTEQIESLVATHAELFPSN